MFTSVMKRVFFKCLKNIKFVFGRSALSSWYNTGRLLFLKSIEKPSITCSMYMLWTTGLCRYCYTLNRPRTLVVRFVGKIFFGNLNDFQIYYSICIGSTHSITLVTNSSYKFDGSQGKYYTTSRNPSMLSGEPYQ